MNNRVDREAKVIYGYSVMSLGPAKGHGFEMDETTAEQLVAIGNAAGDSGVKTRVRHPSKTDDGFGRYLGQSKNFRRDGNRVLADLHLSQAAFVSPEGDLGTYVMARAEEGGAHFGASPEIEYTLERNGGRPVARLRNVGAIAIVDDPATNVAFFSCLSVGENEMADQTALETKVAELSAERDLLAEEVARLKADNAKLGSDLTTKSAELSVAKAEATSAAVAAERARVADVLALCSKAGKADLSAKYIADGTPTADVQATLFEALCSANAPIGEGANDPAPKPTANAKYEAEYKANAYLSAKMTLDEYVETRLIDDGVKPLVDLAAA